MAPRRENRYSSAVDFAQDIESWLSERDSLSLREIEQLISEHRNMQAKYEVEGEVRALVQEVFCPKCRPSRSGYEFFDFYEAHGSRSTLLDYAELADGSVAVFVADMLGMEHARETLWIAKFWGQMRLALATATKATQVYQIVGTLDKEMAAEKVLLEKAMFVRLTLMVLDSSSHEIAICNAGHPAPLLCGDDASLKGLGELEPRLMLGLGLPDDILHAHRSLTLGSGESLLLYSSGLIEARDAYEVPFGIEGIREAAVPGGATALGNAILTRFRQYAKKPDLDDVWLICLGRSASRGQH